ncbi:MAG: copper chaperone PCu(A)C [Hellea sp.]|nr:copper chaperone PCu(A)C [Hellea sp.]
MKKFIFTAMMAGSVLSACTAPADTGSGIVVSDARIKSPMKGRAVTAGYFELTNHSDLDDALTGISSSVAGRVELHNTIIENDISKMRRQETVPVKSGETVIFKPGSYHIMLFDVNLSPGATDAALTFSFEHADDITIIADITGGMDHKSHH